MTTREELTSRGFYFFMFTKPEARAEFRERTKATFEFEEFEEVHCAKEFKILFLAVKRLGPTLKQRLTKEKP